MTKRKPPRVRGPHRAGAAGGQSAGHGTGHAAGHRPPPGRPGAAGIPHRAGAARGGGNVWLYGNHAVAAALANPLRRCLRLVASDAKAAEALLAAAPSAACPSVDTLDRAELDRSVADICAAAADDAQARVVVLDQVTDPQNVGAVLRSAAAFGALAVIVQDRHAPPVTGALARAASGALEHVALVRAVNLNRALGELKDAGFWTVGLDGEAP